MDFSFLEANYEFYSLVDCEKLMVHARSFTGEILHTLYQDLADMFSIYKCCLKCLG